MKKVSVFAAMMAAFAALSQAAAAVAPPQTFQEMPGYPAVSQSVVADVLGNGRFILYDGNGIYVEDGVNAGTFTQIAEGYLGDPAFVAVAPDGHTCLIGAGEVDWTGDPSNDWVWLFDAHAPQDASPSGGLALITSAYAAVWLTDRLVLLDCAPGWVSELAIFDVNTLTYRNVVNKGESSASVALGRFTTDGWLYATVGYGTGAGTTRRFRVQELIDTFSDADYDPLTSPVDWTRGELVGIYDAFTVGVTAVTDGGTLVLSSHDSEILYVHPTTGEVISGPVNPTGGNEFTSVKAYFNPVTKRILVTETDWGMWAFHGYISDEYHELPAVSGLALVAASILIACVGGRRSRSARQ